MALRFEVLELDLTSQVVLGRRDNYYFLLSRYHTTPPKSALTKQGSSLFLVTNSLACAAPEMYDSG